VLLAGCQATIQPASNKKGASASEGTVFLAAAKLEQALSLLYEVRAETFSAAVRLRRVTSCRRLRRTWLDLHAVWLNSPRIRTTGSHRANHYLRACVPRLAVGILVPPAAKHLLRNVTLLSLWLQFFSSRLLSKEFFLKCGCRHLDRQLSFWCDKNLFSRKAAGATAGRNHNKAFTQQSPSSQYGQVRAPYCHKNSFEPN